MAGDVRQRARMPRASSPQAMFARSKLMPRVSVDKGPIRLPMAKNSSWRRELRISARERS